MKTLLLKASFYDDATLLVFQQKNGRLKYELIHSKIKKTIDILNDKEFPDAYQEIPKEYQKIIRYDQLGYPELPTYKDNIDSFRTYFNNLLENSYYKYKYNKYNNNDKEYLKLKNITIF